MILYKKEKENWHNMKYFIFGDTGGHYLQLRRSLENLGFDVDNHLIPEGMSVIHLGDLIHKGPHSELLIEFVDNFITKNPGRWIQILGNHEFQHVGGPWFWKCDCSTLTKFTLKKWWDDKQAFAAYSLDNVIPPNLEVSANPRLLTPLTSWFFSHGGLTYQFWNTCGKKNAKDTAAVINQMPVKQITYPGELLFGPGSTGPKVGCVWAIGNTEVYNSWENSKTTPPFNQVYGHTTSYVWNRKTWWGGGFAIKNFKANSKLNPNTRAVITNLGENTLMVGIDPGYSEYASQKVQSYITLETL